MNKEHGLFYFYICCTGTGREEYCYTAWLPAAIASKDAHVACIGLLTLKVSAITDIGCIVYYSIYLETAIIHVPHVA